MVRQHLPHTCCVVCVSLCAQDKDGADFDLNHEVNCTAMGVQDILFNIYSWYKVVNVKVNNASLDWQLKPNTPYSNWLTILDVGYDLSEFTPYEPMAVQVRCVTHTQHPHACQGKAKLCTCRPGIPSAVSA